MKLRLPSKLVAAIMAAASPVLYTTLSTATIGAGAAIVMASAAQATESGVLHVYVLTGQSNSLGTVRSEPLMSAQLSGHSVAEDEALLWTANMHQDSGLLYVPNAAQWSAVQPQFVSSSDPLYMGPEFGFAYMMQKKGWNTATTAEGVDNDIAIVKAALDGGGNKNWQKYVVNGAYVDEVAEGQEYTINPTYQQILNQVKNAVSAAAAKGYSEVNIEGLLYLQGESNGTSVDADVHYQKFVENLTSDLQAWKTASGLANVTVSMGDNTVVGQTAFWSGRPNNENSMPKLKMYADSTNGTTWIYTRDLDEQNGDGMNVHYNGASQLTIGARYAYAFAVQNGENVGMVRNSNYNAALDSSDAWWMGNAPTAEDVVHWDLSSVSSISATTVSDNLNNTTTIPTSATPGNHINESLAVKGIVVEEVYQNRDYTTGTVRIDGGRLNIGSEGITLQGGDLVIDSEVHATADQTWSTQNAHRIVTTSALVIDNGATLKIADGSALTFRSVEGEGNLVLGNVSLGMNMSDFSSCPAVGDAKYSDGDNGFYTGARTIMNLSGGITLQPGAVITGVGALAGANFEISADGHRLTAAAESATEYFIRNGKVRYGVGTDAYGATNLVLAAKSGSTATLSLESGLKPHVGIQVSGSGNTLELAKGVSLDKSDLAVATSGSAKLIGSGMYRLNAADNSGVNLGTGVSIGNKDEWTGIVMLGATNLGVSVDLNSPVLSNANSFVGLSGAYSVPKSGQWNGPVSANLYLEDTSTGGAAWTWNAGSSGDPATVTFSGKLAGDGTILKNGKASNKDFTQHFKFTGDIRDWTGAIKIETQAAASENKRTTLTFSNNATAINAAILDTSALGINMVLTEDDNPASDYHINNTAQLYDLMAGTKNITLGTNTKADGTQTVGNISISHYAAVNTLTLGSGTTAAFTGGTAKITTLSGTGGTMVVNGGTVTLTNAITGTVGIDLQSGSVNGLNIGNGGNVTLTQSDSAVWGSVSVGDGGTLTLGSGVLTVSGEVTMAETAKLDVSTTFLKNLVMEGAVSSYKDGANEGNGYAQYTDASFKLIQKQDAVAARTAPTELSGTGLLDGWTLTADANGVTAAGGEFAAGTYYVNTTVDYGKDVTTNTAYTGATELQLHADGATLNLLSNLNPDVCDGGITTKGDATAIAATVNIGEGVELNATDVHRAGTDTISLTGSGTFAMTGINSTGKRYNVESSLPEGLSFGEAWAGTLSLSGNIEQLWLGGAKAGSTVRLDGVTGFMGGSYSDTDNIVAKVEIGEGGYTFTNGNSGTRAFKGGFSGTGNVVHDDAGGNSSPVLTFASDMSGFTGSIINKKADGGFTLNFNTGASVVNATSIRNEGTAANMLITMNVNDNTAFNTLVDAGNGKINMNVAADKTATFTKDATLTTLSAASGSVTLSGDTTLTVNGDTNIGTLTLGEGSTAKFIGGGVLNTVVGNGGNLTLGVPQDNPDRVKWTLNSPVDLGQGTLSAYYNTTDVWLDMNAMAISQCDTVGGAGYTFSEDDGHGHRDGYAIGDFIIVKAGNIINDRSFAPAVFDDDSGVVAGHSLTVTDLSDGRKGLVLSLDGEDGAYMVNWNVDYSATATGNHNAYGASNIVLTTPGNAETGQHSTLNILSPLENGVTIKSNGGVIILGDGIMLNPSVLSPVGTGYTTVNSNGGTGALVLSGTYDGANTAFAKLNGDANVLAKTNVTLQNGVQTHLTGPLTVNNGAILTIGTGDGQTNSLSSFTSVSLDNGTIHYENKKDTLTNVSVEAGKVGKIASTDMGQAADDKLILAGDTLVDGTLTISNWWNAAFEIQHLTGSGELKLKGMAGARNVADNTSSQQDATYTISSLAGFSGTLTVGSNNVSATVNTGDAATAITALSVENSTKGTAAGVVYNTQAASQIGTVSVGAAGKLTFLGSEMLTVNAASVQNGGTLNIGDGTNAGNVMITDSLAGTVNVQAGSSLTLNAGYGASGSAVLTGAGKLVIDGDGKVTLGESTTFSTTGMVQINSGSTLEMKANATLDHGVTGGGDLLITAGTTGVGGTNNSTFTGNILVSGEGATLMVLGNAMGLGEQNRDVPDKRYIKAENGGIINVNGWGDGHTNGYAITLGNNGTLMNERSNIDSGHMQIAKLIVTGSTAYINGTHEFGIVASQHGDTTLQLNGNTLEKKGANNFMLINTTVNGGGTIRLTEGSVQIIKKNSNASGVNFEFNGGTLKLDNGLTLTAGGLTMNSAYTGNGSIVDGGNLTLTLGNNANSTYRGTLAIGNLTVKGGPDRTQTLNLTGTSTASAIEANGGATLALGSANGSTLTATSAKVINAGSLLRVEGAQVNLNGALQVSESGGAGAFAMSSGGLKTSKLELWKNAQVDITGGSLEFTGENAFDIRHGDTTAAGVTNLGMGDGKLSADGGVVLKATNNDWSVKLKNDAVLNIGNVTIDAANGSHNITLQSFDGSSTGTMNLYGTITNNANLTLGGTLVLQESAATYTAGYTADTNGYGSASHSWTIVNGAAGATTTLENLTLKTGLGQTLDSSAVTQTGATVTATQTDNVYHYVVNADADGQATTYNATAMGSAIIYEVHEGKTLKASGSDLVGKTVVLDGTGSTLTANSGISFAANQLKAIEVLGDGAVVNATSNIGLIYTDGTATALTLHGHTLAVSGSGHFALYNTTVDKGTIALAAGACLQVGHGGGPARTIYAKDTLITMANNSQLAIGNNSEMILGGIDTLEGAVAKMGYESSNHTLTLDVEAGETHTFKGNIAGGDLRLKSTGEGTQKFILTADATLGQMTLTAGTLAFESANALTISGVISGNGSLEKTGSGTLTLSNANTFTSDLLVKGYTLNMGNNQALGATNGGTSTTKSDRTITIGKDGVIDMKGYDNIAYEFVLDGGSLVNTGGGTYDTHIQNSGLTLTANSSVGGSGDFYIINNGWEATDVNLDGYTLTKTGTNTVGFYSSTITGGKGGALRVEGGAYEGRTNHGSTSVLDADVVIAHGTSAAVTGQFIMNGGHTISTEAAGATMSAATKLRGATTLKADGDTNTLTISGVLSNATGSTGSIIKTGTGVVTLSAANTYTGGTDVQAGTLVVSNGTSSTLSNSMSIADDAELKLTMGNGTYTISGNVSGEGDMTIYSLNADRIYNFTGDLSKWTGNLRQLAGSGSMTLNFSGTEELNANIYNEVDNTTTCFMDVNVKSSMAVNGEIGTAAKHIRNLTVGADESAEMTATFGNDVAVDTLKVNNGATASFGADHTLTAKDAYAYNGGTLNLAGTTSVTTALHLEGGKVKVTGGTTSVKDIWSSGEGGTVALSGTAVMNVAMSNGWGFQIKGSDKLTVADTATLNLTTNTGETLAVTAHTDTDTDHATITNTGDAYSIGNTGTVIDHANVDFSKGENTATLSNKLTNSTITNSGKGTLTVDNAANTLVGVHAKDGAVVVQNAGSSKDSLDSINAMGADVTLKSLGDRTSLNLTELVIGDSKTVAALENDSHTANSNEDIATIEVAGKLTVGQNANLNANLVMKAGSTYDMSKGNALNLGCALTLEQGETLTLSTEQSDFLKANNYLVLYEGVDSLTLISDKSITTTEAFDKYAGYEASDYFTNLLAAINAEKGAQYYMTYSGADNGGIVAIVPEPTTSVLSLLALAGMAARRRRK